MERSEHPFKVKVALSVGEALKIIKEHEKEKTVLKQKKRLSVYTSTKDFRSTGKSFYILIIIS